MAKKPVPSAAPPPGSAPPATKAAPPPVQFKEGAAYDGPRPTSVNATPSAPEIAKPPIDRPTSTKVRAPRISGRR